MEILLIVLICNHFLFAVLHLCHQVYAEFERITQVDLKKTFLSSLEKHSTALIKMYRAKGGKAGEELKTLLDVLDGQVLGLK